MIALDTETTGVDFYHGAGPYFVTVCQEDGTQTWWEWNVDPLTRKPEIPEEDTREIRQLLAVQHDGIVLQNAKFDAAALLAAEVTDWTPLWPLTHDTLLAGHLLASNQPHDLTSMAYHYLGRPGKVMDDLERALEEACKEARRVVQQAKLRKKRGTSGPRKVKAKVGRGLFGKTTSVPAALVEEDENLLADWRIAEAGLEDMPSAKEKSWKIDGWLPRALAVWAEQVGNKELCERAAEGGWRTALRDYANADSAVTLALWRVLERLLKERDLWEIYLEKKKNLEAVLDMERGGVTVLVPALLKLRSEYESQSVDLETSCREIAKSCGHDLTLPKGSANNNSLIEFLFGTLKLPTLKWTDGGKTGVRRPAFDKDVIEEYKRTLEGVPLEFVKSLSRKRKRGKSLEFLADYLRHGIDGGDGTLVLHPSLNPMATATTRLSCNNPNLQQCSKQETACERCDGEGCAACGSSGQDLHSVRTVFGPGPGREWWSLDAENIELRIPAYVSGQPELIALFERPDEPPFFGSQHLLNFSIVYPDVWEKALPHQLKSNGYVKERHGADYYQWCKNGDFAIQYQCGEETADRTFRRRGAYRALKAKFSKLDALNRRCVADAERLGYVETLPDRTVNPRRGYPLLCARTEWGRVLPTLPFNYMVQGTAGWWMIRAINLCQEQLKEWQRTGFTGRMILTVHDELMFDFPAGGKKNLPKMLRLKSLMESVGEDIGVPLKVSCSWHPKNWAEKVKW